MSGQLDINGNVQPVTWDGEPVYSPETVAEGLFDGGAFEQMKGQLAIEPGLEWNEFEAEEGYDCPRCDSWISISRRYCPTCELDTQTELR